jgi:hypothetical protein
VHNEIAERNRINLLEIINNGFQHGFHKKLICGKLVLLKKQ